MDFDFDKDRITGQCANCNKIRRAISDWTQEKREYDRAISQIFCPDCRPKKYQPEEGK